MKSKVKLSEIRGRAHRRVQDGHMYLEASVALSLIELVVAQQKVLRRYAERPFINAIAEEALALPEKLGLEVDIE